MKKTQILVAAFFALTMNLSSVFASENSNVKSSNQLLSDQIVRVFYSAPLEDLLDKKSEQVTVLFKISQDHQLVLLKVDGENKDLVRYSSYMLKNRKIKVDPSIEVKYYKIPVRFVNK